MNRSIGHRLKYWLSLSMCSLMAGCAVLRTLNMKSHWTDAHSINTIEAYEAFLRQYPEGELADQARSRLEVLKSVLKDVEAIRIVVNQSYGLSNETTGEGGKIEWMDKVELPFRDICRKILAYGDVEVKEDEYDITLRVSVRGEALKPHPPPRVSPGVRCYSGARIEGRLSLGRLSTKRFEGVLSPPYSIPAGYKSPESAPFLDALNNSSFRSHLFEILAYMRGVDPAICALGDRDSAIRAGAAELLGKMRAIRAVEPLIGLLKDRLSRVRQKAAEALGQIGDTRAIPSLRELAENDHIFTVRQAASEALDRIQKAQDG